MVILLTFLFWTISICNAQLLTLPSGRRLSISSVHALFPTVHFDALSSRLYEWSPARRQFRCSQTGDVISLRFAMSWGQRIHVPSFPGEEGQDPVVRVHNDIAVAMLHGSILGVWGRNLSLLPLHHEKFRNLFLHTPYSKENKAEEINRFPKLSWTAKIFQSSTSIHKTGENQDLCLHRKIRKGVEVALEFDHTLCARYGNDVTRTISAVRAALALSNRPYEAQTCLSLQPVHISGSCDPTTDPYAKFSSYNADKVLDECANMWWHERKHVHRDLALFVPGFTDKSDVSGVAFIGAACNARYGFAWAENLEPLVMAHEIGHVLNAFHVEDGLMGSRWAPEDELVFSKKSVEQIANFVDRNRAAGCIAQVSTSSPSVSPSMSVASQNDDLGSEEDDDKNNGTDKPSASVSTTPSAASPIVSPSTISSPSPSSMPSPSSELSSIPTCSSGWSRENLLKCTRFLRIGRRTVNISAKNIGSISFFMKQDRGSFFLRYRAHNVTWIKTIGYTASMKRTKIKSAMVPPLKNFPQGPGRKVVRFSLHPDKIEMTAEVGGTCCRKKIFVYTMATVCRRKICKNIKFRLGHWIRCTRCPIPRRFILPSENRRCPGCKKAFLKVEG